MADPINMLLKNIDLAEKAKVADLAAREMAKHCDKRIAKMRKAMSLIDTFAWSAVRCDCKESTRELHRRIEIVRAALREM